MNIISRMDSQFRCMANGLGTFLPQLFLRLFLAYEFGMAGWRKYNAENWFANVQDNFPWPFNWIGQNSAAWFGEGFDLNWFLATWSELVGAVMLAIGLGTRYACVALIILDAVAWVSVHGGNGYNVCQNGYQLPLMYMIMLITLLCSGAGKLSLDHFFGRAKV